MTGLKDADLLALVTEKEVVEVCQKLVQLKSVNPPGGERAIAEWACEYLLNAGLEVELIEHAPDRASVLARMRGSGTAPGLLFSAHLDTVPVGAEAWLHDAFGGEVAEGKVWGRGSSDMKGGMAAMMVAVKLLKQAGVTLQGDVILAFTAGEETDSLGAVALAKRDDIMPVQALLVSEPSSNEIFVAEKGALWLEISTYGRTAHGSMPDLGRNAILMMNAVINELQTLEIPFENHHLLGGFSRSVNTIQGGVKTNVVPDFCTMTIDMRTVPGQINAKITQKVQDMLDKLAASYPDFSAKLTVLNDRLPVTTAEDHPLVAKVNEAVTVVRGQPSTPAGVRYYTDAAAYVPVWDVPMIICGPGQAGMAHQPNEFVEVDRLVESVKIYLLATTRLLG